MEEGGPGGCRQEEWGGGHQGGVPAKLSQSTFISANTTSHYTPSGLKHTHTLISQFSKSQI